MKFKKIVGIIQLVGGITLSLTTFLVWEITKKNVLRVYEKTSEIISVTEYKYMSLLPTMMEGFSGLLFFIFIITLIISALIMLQGVVNIKE